MDNEIYTIIYEYMSDIQKAYYAKNGDSLVDVCDDAYTKAIDFANENSISVSNEYIACYIVYDYMKDDYEIIDDINHQIKVQIYG